MLCEIPTIYHILFEFGYRFYKDFNLQINYSLQSLFCPTIKLKNIVSSSNRNKRNGEIDPLIQLQ